MADTSSYEILFDLPAGDYNDAEVGGIRTKTIRAGESIEVECFPIVKVGEAARREMRRRRCRPAQAILNRRNAEKRIRRLLEANFTRQDYSLTLTWDYGAVDREHMGYAQARKLWDAMNLPVDEEFLALYNTYNDALTVLMDAPRGWADADMSFEPDDLKFAYQKWYLRNNLYYLNNVYGEHVDAYFHQKGGIRNIGSEVIKAGDTISLRTLYASAPFENYIYTFSISI